MSGPPEDLYPGRLRLVPAEGGRGYRLEILVHDPRPFRVEGPLYWGSLGEFESEAAARRRWAELALGTPP